LALSRLARGVARRLAAWPLRAVDAGTRVEALESLSEQAIVDATVPGATLRFFAPTPLLRSRAAGLLDKEPDTIRWIDAMSARAVLWDIGANVGVYSLYASARSQCTVLAFEPSAANFYILSRNIQLNRLEGRVSAYCVALSGATGLGVLNLDSSAPGTAMSQFGHAGEASRYSSEQPTLQAMIGFTIDDFIARFDPPFPTSIKLDVDGLEWPILQGATRTLNDRRLTSLMVELSLTNNAERDRATHALTASGFTFHSRGAAQGAGGEQAANHLFVRS
jgi:FkbM family methyltransferase